MVAEQTLAATTHGTSTAGTPVLVLMHFLGGSQREWDEVLPLLSPGHAAVTLDMPGFGDSADVTGYTVGEMADAVQATIDAQALGRYILVGHSMSGKVAAVLARRAQDRGDERLAGLVLVAPSPPSPEPMADEKRYSMIAALGHESEDELTRARSYITKNEQRDLPKDVELRAAHEVLRMNRTAWVAWLTMGSREDWSERVGTLLMPTVVVAGEKDNSLGPKQQEEFTLPHFADSRMESVPGCSHLVPMERPMEMAAILNQCVSQWGSAV